MYDELSEYRSIDIRGSRSKINQMETGRVGFKNRDVADLLTWPKPPAIWPVMDEAVLRRPIGGPVVMRAQLEHLIQQERY